jgi:Tfp pilus assembly protein PilN
MRLLTRRKRSTSEPVPAEEAQKQEATQEEGQPAPKGAGKSEAKAVIQTRHEPRYPRTDRFSERLFSKARLTVSLEKDVIRAVVFKGRQVVAWGTSTIPEEVGSADKAVHSERLHELLKQLGKYPKRVVVDLPLYAPLTRHFELPKLRRRYLEQVVVSEILETIPFTREEVDLAWQIRRNGHGNELLSVTVSKQVIDEQVRVLIDGGARPKATYPKAMALAHIAGLPDVIVAHLGSVKTAVVLVRHSVPQVVHQVVFSEKDDTPQKKAEVVARAVREVAAWHETVEPREESQEIPVIITGMAPAQSPLARALQEQVESRLVHFTPPFTYPEHFSPQEYAINLGLVLADQLRTPAKKTITGQWIPSIDLLPERHQPRRIPMQPIGVFCGLILFGAAAYAATGQVNVVRTEEATRLGRLEQLQRQQRQQKLASIRITTIDKDTGAMNKLIAGMESQLTSLDSEAQALITRLDALTRGALPPDVGVSTLSRLGEALSIAGNALAFEDVLQYAANLQALGIFTDVRVVELSSSQKSQSTGQPTSGKPVSFQLKASFGVPGSSSESTGASSPNTAPSSQSGTSSQAK